MVFNLLPGRLTVGQAALNRLIQVRILAGQPFDSLRLLIWPMLYIHTYTCYTATTHTAAQLHTRCDLPVSTLVDCPNIKTISHDLSDLIGVEILPVHLSSLKEGD